MEQFLPFYETNDWARIWPELSLALGAIMILGLELFGKKDSSSVRTGAIAIFFQSVLFVGHLLDYLFWQLSAALNFFSDMISQGLQTEVMRSFFLLSSLRQL